jgi:hypothetical protein
MARRDADDVGDRKYQFMEQNLQRRVVGLKDKLPDIQKTLDTVHFLKARKVCLSLSISPPFPLTLLS